MAAVSSRRDRAALARVRFVSRTLDNAIRIPGTTFRIGLDPILGILPGAGDAVSMAISLYVLFEAIRLGVPWLTIARMLAVLLVDAVIGSIPLLGPVFDAVFKANERNLATFEAHITDRERGTEPV